MVPKDYLKNGCRWLVITGVYFISISGITIILDLYKFYNIFALELWFLVSIVCYFFIFSLLSFIFKNENLKIAKPVVFFGIFVTILGTFYYVNQTSQKKSWQAAEEFSRYTVEQQKKFEEDRQNNPQTYPKIYYVQSGDSLWTIAQNYYGNGISWPFLIIDLKFPDNPGLIYVGQEVTIPKL
ncbi:LysM peptidoglycan-binding domain-containing protein [Candidatus Microgenomates bacterium]|nr:LysM peptidoglycan-binding domain-containing protein [Candidatus Microgenomates bacterium]